MPPSTGPTDIGRPFPIVLSYNATKLFAGAMLLPHTPVPFTLPAAFGVITVIESLQYILTVSPVVMPIAITAK